MPFDLQSSQKISDVPVTPEAPAFDLNNSEVIDNNVPVQHTFRETTNQVVAAPYGLTSEEIENYDDLENHNPSAFEKYFLDPSMRGVATANQSVAAAYNMAGLSGDTSTGKALIESEMVKHKFAAPESITKGVNEIMSSKTFGQAFKNIVKHPAAFENLMVESAVSSVPSIALGMATGGYSMIGRALGFGVGSGITEYGTGMLDMLSKRKVDMSDESAVRKAINDPDFMKEAQSRGMKRGVIIGMVDALSAGMAGKFSATGSKVINNATEVAAQAASGAGGEALGQLATDGAVYSPADILLEGLAETISGIPEIALARGEMARVSVPNSESTSTSDIGDTNVADIAQEVDSSGVDTATPVTEVRAEPVVVYPPDLRSARAKIENEYMMSPEAVEEADPYSEFKHAAEDLSQEVVDDFQAHGIMTGDIDANLIDLLDNGIDPERGFNSGPPRAGTNGVDSTRNVAPYIIISDKGKSIPETGVKNVVLVGPSAANIDTLRQAYPNVNFMTVPESKIFMESGGTVLPQTNAAATTSPQHQASVAGGGNIVPPTTTSSTYIGGNNPPQEFAFTEEELARERDYAKVAATPSPPPPSNVRAFLEDVSDTASDWLVPMSTRLGKIHQSLVHAVRKFTFNVGLHTHQDKQQAEPFIQGIQEKMTPEDFRVLDLALKNGDAKKTDALMEKYGLTEAWQSVRAELDRIHAEAKEAGIDLGFIENYFPRQVKKDQVNNYMAALRDQDEWNLIQQAMDKEYGEGAKTLTQEERAEFANMWLRGYKNDTTRISRAGNIKERGVDYVTPENVKYYKDSIQALIDYIGGMRYTIETHKLFGKSEKDTEENIGHYVLNLIDQGVITPDQEMEVRKILKAVVQPTSAYGALAAIKNATYIYTMGSPTSAITQLGDLAFSMYENGFFRTVFSVGNVMSGKSELTREEVGISDILHEFEDQTSSGKAVRLVFKGVGIQAMDKLGKQVLMDGAIRNLRKAAVKGDQEFVEQMEAIFGDEAAQTIEDLKSGTKSENVRYLGYAKLLDYQPASITEMPLAYANAGKGRIMWMLKSYTIKQIDVYRREIFAKMASGSGKQAAQGIGNLIKLGSALMLMGMTADALKDLMMGRDIDLDDLVEDNIWKTIGFSKYQIYKSREEGFATAFWNTLFVPKDMLDDVGSDAVDFITDEKDFDELESTKGIPYVGKMYYWWEGAGSDKE